MRGGEKVLEVFCELFPEATLYTLLHNVGAMSSTIERMKIRTSFVDHLPFKSTKYRNYLPIFPKAVESFDLSEYDLIFSTSHCVAKGAIPSPTALHLCYCHTPMRYVWDMYDQYFGVGKAGLATRLAMAYVAPRLRRWDVSTSSRVHYFIANSHHVAKRIETTYRRTADVIHAPVDTTRFVLSHRDDGYYLIVSALVPYKRVDLAIEAFNSLGERLVVVGTGPERESLERQSGPTVEFVGWQSDQKLSALYAGCRALIFPGVEDFGIVPLEAMACGKPVVAFRAGGALETVVDQGESQTGVFFDEQSPASLTEALHRLREMRFDPAEIRKHAKRFDRTIFKERIRKFVEEKLKAGG
ncbi:MAG: glycosyltransferase family 4 protein [Ignavibacteria bacterium]|nr:glycosyltransferase family 4 protein [Ignavibacteria bacterium]